MPITTFSCGNAGFIMVTHADGFYEKGWTKKRKGRAKIYTHPNAFEGRAIVQNNHGISFNGKSFETLEAAQAAALSALEERG